MNRLCASSVARVAAVFVLASVLAPVSVRAQNPPFRDPALDSNCYFPRIGNPSEMDTVVGAYAGQFLGDPFILNLGPKRGGGYGNLFIGNLTPPAPDPVYTNYTLSQVETGPGFNLHRMKEHLQSIVPNNKNNHLQVIKPIHFRDRAHLDLYARVGPSAGGMIYLADDNGNYDTNSYVILGSSVHGNLLDSLPQYSFSFGFMPLYVTRLTNDSLDDIVDAIYTRWKNGALNTSYLLLFKGRSTVSAGDTIYEDTSCVLYPNLDNSPYRYAIQGDFRGTGREDWIVAGQTYDWPGSRTGDLLFFANNRPFTLQRLADAINYDTIMASGQNPHLLSIKTSPFSMFTMPAFPKSGIDRSTDLLITCEIDTEGMPAIFLFRGGPDFGSHRITLDSAGYVIHNPFGKGYTWPLVVSDAGDMTGTGYHVLHTAGSPSRHVTSSNFYVTGAALDDKIDMYNIHLFREGAGDTLTANGDGLGDYLVNLPDPFDDMLYNAGTLWLYYGSKKIPVHLNPKFASVRSSAPVGEATIEFSPNPVTHGSSVATIDWPESETASYEVRNLLGQVTQQGSLWTLGGAEQQQISFSDLASGVYYFTVYGLHAQAHARVVVAR